MIYDLLKQLDGINIKPPRPATDAEKKLAQEISKKLNGYIQSGDLVSAQNYLKHMKNELSSTNK